MARNLCGFLHISGCLSFPHGVSVGGLAGAPDIDLPLARNVAGDLIIPSTSLTGVLKAWATRQRLDVDALFGGITEGTGASALIVSDVVFDAEASVELRDHVGIDRRTGGAASGVLYRREQITSGERAEFQMTIELPLKEAERSQRIQSVADLVGALESEGLPIGAATSTGLGVMQLTEAKATEERLDSIADLLAGASPTPVDLPARRAAATAVGFEIAWRAEGPIMVKAGLDGVAIDGLPLVTRPRDKKLVQLLLPGSSIKGRLRTLAEYITRTVAACDAQEKFLDQLAQLEVVDRLFGARPGGRSDTGARGALTVRAVVLAEVPADLWDDLALAAKTEESDAELRTAIRRLDNEGWGVTSANRLDVASHVAIDRWTGSSAGARLFTAIEPQLPGPHTFVFHVDEARLGDDEVGLAASFLWLLVLREVASNSVAFGFGTHRGYGSISVPDGLAGVTIGGSFKGVLAPLNGLKHLGEVEGAPIDHLRDAWVSHCKLIPQNGAAS